MRQPTLPAELIRAIIKLLNDGGRLQEIQRTLAACCLTSKAFLPYAREELYRNTKLRTSSNLALPRTIISAPHVASLIQDLSFWTWTAEPSRSRKQGQKTLIQAVAACKNVKRVTLSCWNGDEGLDGEAGEAITEALVSSAGTLETLEMKASSDWLPEDLSKVFSPFTRLRRLRIDDVDFDRPYHFSTLPTFRLERFEAHQGLDAAVLGAILSSSTDSLETLAIDVTVDSAALALHRFMHLQTIVLRWHTVGEDIDEIADLDPWFESLGTCTNLKTLELAAGPQDDHHAPSTPFKARPLLRLLPPSLTSFRDSGLLQLNTAILLEIFSHPGHRLLPNLDRMFVSPLFTKDVSWEMEERTSEEQAVCEDAATARGVELRWWGWWDGPGKGYRARR